MHLVVANLCMAFTPWRALKVAPALLAGCSLARLPPYHPLRAAFYCGLLIALSLIAMGSATAIGQQLSSRYPA